MKKSKTSVNNYEYLQMAIDININYISKLL